MEVDALFLKTDEGRTDVALVWLSLPSVGECRRSGLHSLVCDHA
jgi:hypothetical protein